MVTGYVPSIDQWVVLLLTVPLALAVASDASTLKIPNRIPSAIAGLYAAYALAGWPSVDVIGGMLTGFAVLVIGFVAFSRGMFGGGDAKMLAALALWAGPSLILELIVVTSVAGGVIAAAIAGWALLRRRATPGSGGGIGCVAVDAEVSILYRPMPYGIAIAAGGVHTVIRLLGV